MATDTPARRPRQSADSALHFPLQDNERVLKICRRHWIFLWPRIVLMALYALIPAIIAAIALERTDNYGGMAARIFWIASAIWIAYWAVRAFLNWYRYHNDIWVVTNQRIIDSTKTNPFSLKMSTADLVNVQDMTVERSGILRTLLDYGDIVCQTAADLQEFKLSGIPDPRAVQLLVDRERDRERMRAPSGGV
jgi:hypothetical protein